MFNKKRYHVSYWTTEGRIRCKRVIAVNVVCAAIQASQLQNFRTIRKVTGGKNG